ncbi:hypothetical protein F5Y07DRAFT_404311 [Xylaria sp. FL0933]|nr:hypothetical protein F5Y07DRAFT_404311 [Xylaria sp. FL0933]
MVVVLGPLEGIFGLHQRLPSRDEDTVLLSSNHADRRKEKLDGPRNVGTPGAGNTPEARKDIAAIRHVLGDSGIASEPRASEDVLPASLTAAAVSYSSGFSDSIPQYDIPDFTLGRAN